MGDVGSLSLGGTLGVIAVIIKQEVLLFFVGGVFVIEALSVIFQVGSFKLRGKRIFRMAPIHHHFELLDGASPKSSCVLDRGARLCAVCSDDAEVALKICRGGRFSRTPQTLS